MSPTASTPIRIFVSVALTAVAALTLAQKPPSLPGGNHEGRRGPRVKPRMVPFPLIGRSAGFTVLLADKREFIEMQSLAIDATPAVVPGLKVATPTVQLEYGYKKGGIGTVYEMPLRPGLDATAAFTAMMKARIYGDRQYFKGWTIKSVRDKKLLIAVSGTTPEVRDALIRALGK